MNCHGIRPQLAAYLDNELDQDTWLTVHKHLRECPSCAGAFDEMRKLRCTLLLSASCAPAESRSRQPEQIVQLLNARVPFKHRPMMRRLGYLARRTSLYAASMAAIVIVSLIAQNALLLENYTLAPRNYAHQQGNKNDGLTAQAVEEALQSFFRLKLAQNAPIDAASLESTRVIERMLADQLDSMRGVTKNYEAVLACEAAEDCVADEYYTEAIEKYNAAAEKWHDTGLAVFPILDVAKIDQYFLEDIEGAARLYESLKRAGISGDERRECAYHLARCYKSLGRIEDAIKEAELLARVPQTIRNGIPALTMVTELNYQRGDYSNALKYAELGTRVLGSKPEELKLKQFHQMLAQAQNQVDDWAPLRLYALGNYAEVLNRYPGAPIAEQAFEQYARSTHVPFTTTNPYLTEPRLALSREIVENELSDDQVLRRYAEWYLTRNELERTPTVEKVRALLQELEQETDSPEYKQATRELLAALDRQL